MEYAKRKLDSSIKLKLLEPIVNQKTKVLVECHCGVKYKISPQCLFRDKKVIECIKCSSKNKIKAYSNQGGLRKHIAYNMLDAIKQRCYNKKLKTYKYYGGIGIKVCDEWLNNYVSFCDWADKNGYKKGLTIDRINVNGNYEPDNCRFVPMSEQFENRHKQKNNSSGFTGVSFQKNIKKWYSYINANKKRINCGYYDTEKEANDARLLKLKELNLNYTREDYE